ncbi:hypothetical protein [Microbispora siamensis]|uniref:Uncharacterized protein n=1 Tax=Microbispora siamensis TaxID=564413 RepID=A0ABQ4GCR8_9ACTN|nr:hypothetical protein [Microbispora siamensis]GIH59191.1 hypothetical protein Msi02_00080 [Microbispora siamensis]
MGSEALAEQEHLREGFDEVLRERQAAAEQILHDLKATLGTSLNTASPQDRYPSS